MVALRVDSENSGDRLRSPNDPALKVSFARNQGCDKQKAVSTNRQTEATGQRIVTTWEMFASIPNPEFSLTLIAHVAGRPMVGYCSCSPK